jgi:hypothetical protein
MSISSSIAVVAHPEEVFSNVEALALSGSLRATPDSPARRTRWTFASSRAGALG